MDEQELTAALNGVADEVEVPERFQKPSLLVHDKVRQTRGWIRYAIMSGVVAIAAAVAVLVMNPKDPINTHQNQRSTTAIVVADSVEEMAASATVIVRGAVGEPLGTWNLSRDPDDISKEAADISPGTDYEITVREYLEGKGPASLVLTVQGGTYKGISELPLQKVEPGKEYVFFLTPFGFTGRTGFLLASAPGYFEIQGKTAIAGVIQGVPHAIPNMGIEELRDRIAITGGR